MDDLSQDSVFENTDPDAFPSVGAKTKSSLEALAEAATIGRESLFILATSILGYDKLNERVHLPMCRFAYQTRRAGHRRMMLMPRTHFKTTIWTIVDSIQLICLNPDIQILIVADTETNASRFMKEIQLHFKRNELFKACFPNIIPENFNNIVWNKLEMEVPRTRISRDPTVDAIGALGGSESRHYDYIKADDLITEKCIRSDTEMDKVIRWAGGLESLLISEIDGQIDYIGSHKKKGDLYETKQKEYGESSISRSIGPFATKKGRMEIFTRAAEENGKPIFPEMVSAEFLSRLRRYEPERYHAQYANSPKASGLNTFPFESLRYYRWTESGRIQCIHDNTIELETHPDLLERLVFFDPSVAENKTSSKQAIHVVGKGSHPYRIVLESWIGHYSPSDAVDYLFELEKKWRPAFFSIERRGYQGSIKYWLEEKAEREEIPFLQVVEWPPKGDPSAQWAKKEHIKALQPIVRANCLWVHETMTDLLEEIEFYPNVRWDDGLDSLTQGLTYWPAAIDELDVAAKKRDEMSYLEAAVLGVTSGDIVEKDAFDEMEFLRQFDPTGYMIAQA